MPTVTMQEGSRVSKTVALQKLYSCLNGPVSASQKHGVKYTMDQVKAMLHVVRQLIMLATDTQKATVGGEKTVADLIEMLKMLPQNEVVFCIDNDSGHYLPVTGCIYGTGEVWLDTEADDANDMEQEPEFTADALNAAR